MVCHMIAAHDKLMLLFGLLLVIRISPVRRKQSRPLFGEGFFPEIESRNNSGFQRLLWAYLCC